MERVGRVLHDRHHRDDGRVSRDSPICPGRPGLHRRAAVRWSRRGALHVYLVAAAVVEGGLPNRLQWRRRERMLETIRDHFIICGYGRIGSTVAAQLRREQVPFVVVERDRGPLSVGAGRRRAGDRGGREPRGRAAQGRHRSGAWPHCGRRHGRGERLRGAQRARAATRISSSWGEPRPRTRCRS